MKKSNKMALKLLAGAAVLCGIGVISYKIGYDRAFERFNENALDVEGKLGDLAVEGTLEKVKELIPEVADKINDMYTPFFVRNGFPRFMKVNYKDMVVKWSDDGENWFAKF